MRLFLVLLFTVNLSLPALAQTVVDPFPKKISRGDVRIELKEAAGGFVTPVWGTHAGDGSGRLFLVDQAGTARIVKGGQVLERPFIDVTPHMVMLKPGFDERGFLGLAFHPGFADKNSPGFGRLYTYTSEPAGPNDYPLPQNVPADHISVIAEWKVSSGDADSVDPASRRVILTFAQPQFNHDGGAIAFGPDKLLYIATGDGGAADDFAPGHAPQGNGQALDNPLGKILRIDPLGGTGAKSRNGQYSVPADNPFVGKDGLDEIFAYGLRNPYRISFDRKSGQLIAADVGQNKVEEIDIVERGGNYGWPIKEGSFFFFRTGEHKGHITRQAPTTGQLPKMIDPVAEYDHDEGISITGGFVYRGKAIAALQGKYVFGDWVRPEKDATSGRLFYADLKTGQIQEFVIGEDRPLGGFVAGFAEDEDGELYVLINKSRGPNTTSGSAMKIVPVQ